MSQNFFQLNTEKTDLIIIYLYIQYSNNTAYIEYGNDDVWKTSNYVLKTQFSYSVSDL